ncbi:MAG: DUF3107 domain-containing protein [Kocuria sp.]|nr:DUF3107 domain-containing protein [Kocuria sp.]
MDIKIGIQHVAREIVVDSPLNAQEAQEAIAAALTEGAVLTLKDTKDNTTMVPTAGIAYVEIGSESRRKVGFMPGVSAS